MKQGILLLGIFLFNSVLLFGQTVSVSVKNNNFSQASLLGFDWKGQIKIGQSPEKDGFYSFPLDSMLVTGVYKIAFDSLHYFDFIADGKKVDYFISVDGNNLRSNVKVDKSPDNDCFQKIRNYYEETEREWAKVEDGNGRMRSGKSWYDKYEYIPSRTEESSKQLFGYRYGLFYFIPSPVYYWEGKSKKLIFHIDELPLNDERFIHTEVFCKTLKYYLLSVYADKEKLGIWLGELEMSKPIATKVVDELLGLYFKDESVAAGKAFCTFMEVAYLNKTNPLSGSSTYSDNEVKRLYDERRFKIATAENSLMSYQAYLNGEGDQRFRNSAFHRIDSLEFNKLVATNNIAEIENVIQSGKSEYLLQLASHLDSLRYYQVLQTNTIPALTAFISSYPKSKFANDATKEIERIKNDHKTQAILEELAIKEKIEAEKRKTELATACEEGVESIVKFANKYQNTAEATQAIRILRKYNAENEVITNKIAVLEKFVWTNKGDRQWIEEVLERQRNDFGGGKLFNTFGFATLQNKTEKELNIVATVKLQLIKTTNLSLLISSSNYLLSENFYMKLAPHQTKSLVVLFKNIREGVTIGRSRNDNSLGGVLFSAGSTINIDDFNPISIHISETTPISQSVINSQNQLIEAIIANKGNIAVNNVSQREVMDKWLDSWAGTNSQNDAVLRVYFTKKGSSKGRLQLFDIHNERISEREISSAGEHTESFTVTADRDYFILIPECMQSVPVHVRKRITQVIFDANCKARINMEDAK